MKKKMGAARAVEPIPQDVLASMPTKALLARLKRLHWCEEGPEHSDLTDEEVRAVEGKILLKSSDIWKQAYADLKTILAGREHVPRKESKNKL